MVSSGHKDLSWKWIGVLVSCFPWRAIFTIGGKTWASLFHQSPTSLHYYFYAFLNTHTCLVFTALCISGACLVLSNYTAYMAMVTYGKSPNFAFFLTELVLTWARLVPLHKYTYIHYIPTSPNTFFTLSIFFHKFWCDFTLKKWDRRSCGRLFKRNKIFSNFSFLRFCVNK